MFIYYLTIDDLRFICLFYYLNIYIAQNIENN